MNDRLRLPFRFDAAAMQADVNRLAQGAWIEHFVKQNYDGAWTVLPLRAPATATHPVQMIYSDPAGGAYVDTPLLAVCPAIAEVLATFQCPMEAVRLMRLGPGSVIKRHHDHDLDIEHGRVRLHIPIATNPDVDFRLNGERVALEEGECWYLRLSDPHEVANRGGTDRIHLVIDAIVSPWLHEQIARGVRSGSDRGQTLHTSVSNPGRSAIQPTPDPHPAFPGWVPTRVLAAVPKPLVEWCDLGGAAFAHPFFTQTIERVRKQAPAGTAVRTPIELLIAEAAAHPALAPTAFIFHASRCGSTLVSQLARALPQTVVISEAPPIDDVLRIEAPRERRIAWLHAVLGGLGQPRRPGDRWFFVKFDAWHVMDLPLIQEAFPGVPCVFVYREPSEVVASQMRMPAMYLLPGALDAGITGMSADEAIAVGREQYAARVLGRIFDAAARFASGDRLSLLNYRDFPGAAIARVLEWTGLSDDAEAGRRLGEVAALDAKTPLMPYDAQSDARRVPSNSAIDAAERFVRRPYDALETSRTNRVSG